MFYYAISRLIWRIFNLISFFLFISFLFLFVLSCSLLSPQFSSFTSLVFLSFSCLYRPFRSLSPSLFLYYFACSFSFFLSSFSFPFFFYIFPLFSLFRFVLSDDCLIIHIQLYWFVECIHMFIASNYSTVVTHYKWLGPISGAL